MHRIQAFRLLSLVSLFSSIPAMASVPPSTGQSQANGRDTRYTITQDTTGQLAAQGLSAPTAAFVVPDSSGGGGWAGVGNVPGTGALWIAPDPDQTNATRNGKYGGTSVKYQLT